MGILYVISEDGQTGNTAFCLSLASILQDSGQKVAVSTVSFSGEKERSKDNPLLSKFVDERLESQPLSLDDTESRVRARRQVELIHEEVDTLIIDATNASQSEQHVELVKHIQAKVICVSRYHNAIDTIPFAKVQASSCSAVLPASRMWYPEMDMIFHLGRYSEQN